MAAVPTFTELFTPVQDDYGLIMLRRVLGCAVEVVWNPHGASCTDPGMIATAAGIFNIGVWVFAAILSGYTVYVTVSNTANDGEAFGSQVSGTYTYLRLGLGAIFLLPVSGGFSIVQLIVIQLFVWGSGGADYLWGRVSPMMLQGGYHQMATLDKDDPRMRGMIADAIRIRAQGYVCQARLNEIAQYHTEAKSDGPLMAAQSKKDGGTFSGAFQSYYFKEKDGSKFYNGTDSICGIVTYKLQSSYAFPQSDQPGAAQDQTTANALRAIAMNAVDTALKDAWTKIDSGALQIAQQVYGAQRDDVEVKKQISNAVEGAQTAMATALNKTIGDQSKGMADLVKNYLTESTKSGWVFAVNYQRANINTAQYFQSIINTATLVSSPPGSLATLLQPMSQSSWFGLSPPRLTGSTWKTLADAYERDMGYLSSFDGYFADFSRAQPIGISGDVGDASGSASFFSISGLMSKLFNALSVDGSSGTGNFFYPLMTLVNIGTSLTTVGFPLLAAGAAGEVISWFAKALPVVSGIASGAGSAAWSLGAILVAAGFWLGGVLPLLPVLYWFGGVVSWLVVGLEALIAVPIWALSHFMPAREPSLIGASRQGWLLLFGLLIRPILMLMGLIVSVPLMFACFMFLNTLFRSVFALSLPIDGGGPTSLIVCGALILVYLTAATVVVTNCCALITELGDQVLRWIEVGVQSLWNSRFGSDAMQTINPAAGVTGGARQLAGVNLPRSARALRAQIIDARKRKEPPSDYL